MNSLLNQNRVLKINNKWKPVGICTVREAIVAMCREKQFHYTDEMERPHCALHIEYPIENGTPNYKQPLSVLPVEWKDWITLPVRNFDKYIVSANQLVRIPTIIIANNYKGIPDFTIAYSKHAVWDRDNSTCQISGERVNKNNGNIEHWVPRKHGGLTTFENTYVVKKIINSLKEDLMPEEFTKKTGLRLRKKLVRPTRKTLIIQNNYNIPDWDMMLEK